MFTPSYIHPFTLHLLNSPHWLQTKTIQSIPPRTIPIDTKIVIEIFIMMMVNENTEIQVRAKYSKIHCTLNYAINDYFSFNRYIFHKILFGVPSFLLTILSQYLYKGAEKILYSVFYIRFALYICTYFATTFYMKCMQREEKIIIVK